ncbi:MAG: hypothetical protein ACR2FS_02105, partial [Phormidesmis sp.]
MPVATREIEIPAALGTVVAEYRIEIDSANGWQPTPIHIRVYAADQSFERAMGRRVAADLPLRLTQDSAFTPSIRQLTDHLGEYSG